MTKIFASEVKDNTLWPPTDFSTAHNLSGTNDGVNKVFDLPTSPTLQLVAPLIILNGLVQKPGTDYTRVGLVVTFTTAPASGHVPWAFM
jgi:hypothetical protein